MLKFGKNGQDFVLVDEKTGVQIIFERGAAKALARFLLVELNIVKLETNEGLKIHESDAEFRRLLSLRWGDQWQQKE